MSSPRLTPLLALSTSSRPTTSTFLSPRSPTSTTSNSSPQNPRNTIQRVQHTTQSNTTTSIPDSLAFTRSSETFDPANTAISAAQTEDLFGLRGLGFGVQGGHCFWSGLSGYCRGRGVIDGWEGQCGSSGFEFWG